MLSCSSAHKAGTPYPSFHSLTVSAHETEGVETAADYPEAALQCTASCKTLCSLNTTAFASSMDTDVAYWDFHLPVHANYITTFPTPKSLYQIATHPNETFWLDPRKTKTYCQWSWRASYFSVPFEGLSLSFMTDEYIATTKQRFWFEYPGKFYNYTW